MTIKPIEEASYIYPNGDYKYEAEDGYYHLIRDGVDLLEDKNAIFCCSYTDGGYEYKTEDGEGIYVEGDGNE